MVEEKFVLHADHSHVLSGAIIMLSQIYDKGKFQKVCWQHTHSVRTRFIIQTRKGRGEFMFGRETFNVPLKDPMLYDRLRILSTEYDISIEGLVNVAVKRLLDDVKFVRNLRTGKTRGV